MSYAEEYFDRFFRVAKIEGKTRTYLIDVYKELSSAELISCERKLSMGPLSLCYMKLGTCEAVISMIGGRAELISLRLIVRPEDDPAGGSLEAARKICLEEAERL